MDPVIIGPLIALGFIGILVLVRVILAASKKEPTESKTKVLVHAINDERCTGCEACVLVCPTAVLELKSNKSKVIRFDDCIQCEQCAVVCPTTALVMFREGSEPPPVLVPDLDDYYQSKVPGLYLLGEAAGKPLVKNAVNLGRAAVEHSLRSGMRPGALAPQGRPDLTCVDVVIVGSGPAGLSAAMSCQQRKLSYVVLEKDAFVASTIARYPKGKYVMAEPYDVRCVGLLPVYDSPKDKLILDWNRILTQVGLDIRLREVVEKIERQPNGTFAVGTDKGKYLAQKVMLCIGTRGKPRRLNVPGEDQAMVQPLLDDPDLYSGKTLLVVGGGDSAVEAALSLATPALRNKVIISYRGKAFNRVKAKNRQAIDQAIHEKRILVLFGSNVKNFGSSNVTMKLVEGRERVIPIQGAFVLIGGDPPIKWLEDMGIGYVQKPHGFVRPPTDMLVERLIGRQPANDKPNLPVSDELSGFFDHAAFASLADEGGGKKARKEATIMVPKDEFLLHLPEKLRVDPEAQKVSQLRHH
ncbi:MAG: NAD(P)-binding domain-containing protein [Myxococcales bacterium]|nr:NAD(P)-binding domain-containing protein [Myxococcales bacterium]